MQRQMDNVVRLRGFKSLNDTAPWREVDATACIDCNNVYTSEGAIRVRPAWATYATGLGIGVASNNGRLLEGKFFSLVDGAGATRQLLALLTNSISGATARWYIVEVTGSPAVPEFAINSISGESDGYPTQIVQYENMLLANYDFNRGSKFYYDGTDLRVEDIGIDVPEEALIISPVGVTGYEGPTNVTYRHTFYNEHTGTESGVGPAVSDTVGVATITSYDIEVPAGAVSADPQVTHIRIYRQNSAVDDRLYFVAQVPNVADATAFTDDNTTADISVEGESPFGSERPPVGNAIAYFKSRMWYVDGGDVLYSEVDRPELVRDPDSRIPVTRADKIVRFEPAFGGLLVFSQRETWIITGDDPSSFAVDRLDSNGCQAPHSVFTIDEKVYYANRYGAFCRSSSGMECISSDIRVGWGQFVDPQLISVAHDRIRNLLLFHQSESGASRTAVYGLPKQNSFRSEDRWWLWSRGNTDIAGMCSFQRPRDRPQVLALRANTNLVTLNDAFGGSDFSANAIAWAWETGDTDLGIGWPKTHNFTRVCRQYISAGDNATIQHGYNGNTLDAGTAVAFNGLTPFTSNQLFMGVPCETLRVKLTGSATVATATSGIDLDLTPDGHM